MKTITIGIVATVAVIAGLMTHMTHATQVTTRHYNAVRYQSCITNRQEWTLTDDPIPADVQSAVNRACAYVWGAPVAAYALSSQVSPGKVGVMCSNGGDATIEPQDKFGYIVVSCGTR